MIQVKVWPVDLLLAVQAISIILKNKDEHIRVATDTNSLNFNKLSSSTYGCSCNCYYFLLTRFKCCTFLSPESHLNSFQQPPTTGSVTSPPLSWPLEHQLLPIILRYLTLSPPSVRKWAAPRPGLVNRLPVSGKAEPCGTLHSLRSSWWARRWTLRSLPLTSNTFLTLLWDKTKGKILWLLLRVLV